MENQMSFLNKRLCIAASCVVLLSFLVVSPAAAYTVDMGGKPLQVNGYIQQTAQFGVAGKRQYPAVALLVGVERRGARRADDGHGQRHQ